MNVDTNDKCGDCKHFVIYDETNTVGYFVSQGDGFCKLMDKLEYVRKETDCKLDEYINQLRTFRTKYLEIKTAINNK
jgi:hypothetical protein